MLACKAENAAIGTEIELPFAFSEAPQLRAWSVITNPDWLVRPTAAMISNAYPREALASHIAGMAKINCEVTVEGRANNCLVVSEAPEGAGFGAAVLELSKSFHFKPQIRDCKPVGGAHIVLPFNFNP